MATAYTSLLGLALPVTGELSGTWGDTVNNSITSLLDTAVAGTTTLSTDADVTLTTTTGSSNQSRQAILLWTANGTTTRNITAPAQSKIYTVINASAGTQSIVLRGAGPTTGVTIIKGESAVCAWNGSDFIKISNTSGAGTFTDLTVTGNTVLGDASTDTVRVYGYMGIGSAASAPYNLLVSGSSTTGVNQYSVGSTATLSGTTWSAAFLANNTAAASTAISNYAGLRVVNPVLGSGASIGSNIGLRIDDLTVGSTNYGIASIVSSGTGKYNVYASGTADNYFAGNVGIGTTSPGTKLEVAGTVKINASTTQQLTIGDFTTLSNSADIYLRTTGLARMLTGGGGSFTWGVSGGSEFARIDSSGNLGLGVTPSAWGGGFKAFELVGGSVFSGASTNLGIMQNAYYDGTNYLYKTSSTAARYFQVGGQHIWYNAASGTAGGTISFTQAMTLDASGRLQIGTTSSGAGQRLIVDSSGANTVYNSQFTYSAATNTAYCATTWTHGQSGTATGYVGVGGSAVSNSAFQNNFVVGTQSSSPLVFNTNDTERARIDTSGNFMVGKTAVSDTTVGMLAEADGGFCVTRNLSTNSFSTLRVYSSAASAYRFYVGMGGTVYATSTTITAISDQRLKENIRDLDDGLDVVMALKPRKFDWKEGKGQDIKNARGFIAQEFEQVLPDMIEEWRDPAPEGEEPYKAINANLIPTLVKAIQELKAEFDAYKLTHP